MASRDLPELAGAWRGFSPDEMQAAFIEANAFLEERGSPEEAWEPTLGRYTIWEVIAAIFAGAGFLSTANGILGCARQTVYSYRDRYPIIIEAIADARKNRGETLHLVSYNLARDGDREMLKFLLQTQHGFNARLNLTVEPSRYRRIEKLIEDAGMDPEEVFDQMEDRLIAERRALYLEGRAPSMDEEEEKEEK